MAKATSYHANGTEWMRSRELMARVPFCRSTLDRLISNGSFPAPVKVASHLFLWRRDEVERYISNTFTASDQQPQEASNAAAQN